MGSAVKVLVLLGASLRVRRCAFSRSFQPRLDRRANEFLAGPRRAKAQRQSGQKSWPESLLAWCQSLSFGGPQRRFWVISEILSMLANPSVRSHFFIEYQLFRPAQSILDIRYRNVAAGAA